MKKSNHVLNHVDGGPEEAEVLIRDKKHDRKPSFLKALLRTFGPYFLIGSFFKLIQDLLSFVNPQLLRLVYSVSSFLCAIPLEAWVWHRVFVFEMQSWFPSQCHVCAPAVP